MLETDASLGGSVPTPQDWGCVVSTRERTPHQCVGAERCLICSKVLCLRPREYPCPPEDGQYLCSNLHTETRGHQVQQIVGGGSRVVGLLPAEENPLISRVSPRLPERQGRLGIEASVRLQRLEAERGPVSGDKPSLGSSGGGPLCNSSQHSAETLCELASRPICYGSGRLSAGVEQNETLFVPSFLNDSSVFSQELEGGSNCGDSNTYVAESAMVSNTVGSVSGCTNSASTVVRHANVSRWRTTPTVGSERPTVSGVESVRQQALATGISVDAANLLAEFSWRKGTRCTYESAWRKWSGWCLSGKIDPLCSPVESVINFLTERYHQGDQYNTLNIQRSAISAFHNPIDGVKVGQHPSVTRIMSAFFNARPPMPRYEDTWEVNPVLDYIISLGDNDTLALKQLTYKITMLLALSCAGRSSDLRAFDVRYMRLEEDVVSFNLAELTKSRRKGKPPLKMVINSFPEDASLCVVSTLKTYLHRTEKFRDRQDGVPRSQVLLSFVEPHRAVVSCTIAGWLIKLMTEAGIDTALFKAHSTRGASTSKAAAMGLSCKEILAMAKWKKQSTFYKHYHRQAVANSEKKTKRFESSVLSH